MILPCPTISKHRTGAKNVVLILGCFSAHAIILLGCASSPQSSDPRLASGYISYPFVADTRPIGRANPRQPFVVRSALGQNEYSVEIPDNAAKYDIQIPLAELSPETAQSTSFISSTGSIAKNVNPANTDKELVGALPDLAKSKGIKTEMLDTAFGVGRPEGPIQSPSYTLGIARVNQHFKGRNFELALVELDNLLTYYPNSPKLLKMKGTLLVKTGNRELAMRAWQRALDLAPNDLALRTSIDRLNERIVADKNVRGMTPSSTDNQPIPAGNIGSDSESLLDKPAH